MTRLDQSHEYKDLYLTHPEDVTKRANELASTGWRLHTVQVLMLENGPRYMAWFERRANAAQRLADYVQESEAKR